MIGSINSQERKALLFIVFIIVLGIFLSHFKRSSTGCNICLIDIYSKKESKTFDINSATREQFASIPGIGPKASDDILAYRAVYGPFKDADSISIKGLSDAQLKILKAYTYIKKDKQQ